MWMPSAETLKGIDNDPQLFDEKSYDPLHDPSEVAKQFSPDGLATAHCERIGEREAYLAHAQAVPMVEDGEPRIVNANAPRH
jgi:hypothetical protein